MGVERRTTALELWDSSRGRSACRCHTTQQSHPGGLPGRDENTRAGVQSGFSRTGRRLETTQLSVTSRAGEQVEVDSCTEMHQKRNDLMIHTTPRKPQKHHIEGKKRENESRALGVRGCVLSGLPGSGAGTYVGGEKGPLREEAMVHVLLEMVTRSWYTQENSWGCTRQI